VDGDGDLDLLTANQSGPTVSVRTNNGLGAFSAGQDIRMGNPGDGIAVGDVDGDGDLDIITSVGASSRVNVSYNNGQGVFITQPGVYVADSPAGIVVGDVDGDGDLDLLISRNSVNGIVSLLINDGTGGFTLSQNVGVGSYSSSVTIGDVDGDGDLDLLAVSSPTPGPHSVSIRLNSSTPLAAITGRALSAIALSPNPALGSTNLSGVAPYALFTITDALGRNILTSNADAIGRAQIMLPATVMSGVYVVRCGASTARLLVE
jgi:hypothetical protein